MHLKIIDKDSRRILFSEASSASTFFQRLLGLLFKKSISEDQALFLYNISSIHTFFMRFSIDIIFTDKDMGVIKIYESVNPWKIVFCRRAFCAIECLGGAASRKNIKVGQTLNIEKA